MLDNVALIWDPLFGAVIKPRLEENCQKTSSSQQEYELGFLGHKVEHSATLCN